MWTRLMIIGKSDDLIQELIFLSIFSCIVEIYFLFLQKKYLKHI